MSRLQDIIARGLAVDRPLATDVAPGTLYYSSDTAVTERSDGANWQSYSDAGTGAGAINQLTGDVTAGPGSGSQAATLANNAVVTAKVLDEAITYAKIQDVSAASKLLGRGDAGAGVVQEITLGANLSITGTTLDAAGGAGWETTITKTTDDSVSNNATLVDDSELQFSTAGANAIFQIEVILLYSANHQSADIKVGFKVAAGAMYGSWNAIHMNTSNSPTNTIFGANDAATTSVQVQAGTDQGASDSKIHAMIIQGTFRASDNTVFSLQFAQNVATPASTTKTRIGSVMRINQIL